ncbi:hypothetical protein [Nocardia higoensis]|uniref:hypothetical protein n=1 Tax=Nocardia higoensis TaxID=228599 RepID=UPI0002D86E5C|nr:hypothetical protein [Nocardia higoensis]
MSESSWAREHYLRRRAHGDRHSAALRNLVNKMFGQLYYCLHHRQEFDSVKAFAHPITTAPEPVAA